MLHIIVYINHQMFSEWLILMPHSIISQNYDNWWIMVHQGHFLISSICGLTFHNCNLNWVLIMKHETEKQEITFVNIKK